MSSEMAWILTSAPQFDLTDKYSLSSWVSPALEQAYIVVEHSKYCEEAFKACFHTFDVAGNKWSTNQNDVSLNIQGINNKRIRNKNEQTTVKMSATMNENGQEKIIVAAINQDQMIWVDCVNERTQYGTMTGDYPCRFSTELIWINENKTILTVGNSRIACGRPPLLMFEIVLKFPDNRWGHRLILVESKGMIIIYGGRSYSNRSAKDEIYFYHWAQNILTLSDMTKPKNGGNLLVCCSDQFIISLPVNKATDICVYDFNTNHWTVSDCKLPCSAIRNRLAQIVCDQRSKKWLCIGYIKNTLCILQMNNIDSIWSNISKMVAKYLLYEWLCVTGGDLCTHWKIQTSVILFDNK